MPFFRLHLPFLRPLGPPKASTFLRFTAPRRHAGSEAINRRTPAGRINKGKTTISNPIQPGKKHPKPSLPRPKKANAIGSRKIGATASNRRRVTPPPGATAELMSSTSPSASLAQPKEEIPEILPYHVTRTTTNHLPIYLQAKRGGNLHQTLIRKISGKVHELKQELADRLQLEGKDAVVNPVTGHIVLKGWWKPQVQQFLEARRF
ncbi:MAG: hypothetical protein M1822_004207 [Bathelium mastoideum]|nr:MAG: hypothetical protein M1822_004207 [Bathelium mastoideum]